MSVGLLPVVLEIPLDRNPDWEQARRTLAQLADDALLAQRALPQSAASADPTADELRSTGSRGLELLVAMWAGDHPYATSRKLSASHVLIFGGPSWGDEPFEGYADATFAIDLGLAEAAGFR